MTIQTLPHWMGLSGPAPEAWPGAPDWFVSLAFALAALALGARVFHHAAKETTAGLRVLADFMRRDG
jgi:hypothetical protein